MYKHSVYKNQFITIMTMVESGQMDKHRQLPKIVRKNRLYTSGTLERIKSNHKYSTKCSAEKYLQV
jgi:hypothetical protein